MALGDEKYIRFTTFKRDGTAVSTPTWIVALDDGRYGFWTSSGAGKAKRLAHTARGKLFGTIGGIVKRNRIPYGDRGVVIDLAADAGGAA